VGSAALLLTLRAGSAGLRSRFLLVVTASGIALAVAGGSLTLLIGGSSSGYVALAPVGFALGVVIVGYAVHMRRVLRPAGQQNRAAAGWTGAAEWMIAFFLIAISLFTAASDYAGGVGVSRARQLAAELPGQPAVVLYSQHDLDLPPVGITRTRCASAATPPVEPLRRFPRDPARRKQRHPPGLLSWDRGPRPQSRRLLSHNNEG
jgi:hypothetical protein